MGEGVYDMMNRTQRDCDLASQFNTEITGCSLRGTEEIELAEMFANHREAESQRCAELVRVHAARLGMDSFAADVLIMVILK